MDAVAPELTGTAVAPMANVHEKFADMRGVTRPSLDTPASKTQRAEEMEILDSPSTAVDSKASPASVDVSSASGSGTPASAAKSMEKAPEEVSPQETCQSDAESDADSPLASADIKPRALEDVEPRAELVGAKRDAPVVDTPSGGVMPESTPEVAAAIDMVADPDEVATPGKKAVDAQVAFESGENSKPEAAPETVAESANSAVQANASAMAKDRPKPPDPTGSVAANRIARLQRSPQTSEEATASLPTEASTAIGRAAAPDGTAASREKALDAEVASVSGETNDMEAAPTKFAPPARNTFKANPPASAKSRPKPPDASGSAATKRIARPQQSPQSSDVATTSLQTKASASEGVARDAPQTKAGDEESNVNLQDCGVMLGEAPQSKPVHSDKGACTGESSMSPMSAGGESRDVEASQSLAGRAKRVTVSAKSPAKGSAKASAKSEARVAQRITCGNVTTGSTPEFPVAEVTSDAGSNLSVNSEGNPAALSQATVRVTEVSRALGGDSVASGSSVAPPAVRPNAVGTGCASSSSDAIRGREKVVEQVALGDERNGLEARTIAEKDSVDKGKIVASEDVLSTPITLGEVITWVNEHPLDEEVLKIVAEEVVDYTHCGCFSRRRSVLSIPGLDHRCQRDKDRVFFLMSTDFDFHDQMHFRILRTAYTKLTGNEACPMVGKHWTDLGFQNTDPRTDLNRSGRLLNVLHFFFFFTHHFEILKSAYLLSRDAEQNFPLACVCINLTQMVAQCLIEGKLSRLCNLSERDVLDTTCKVFAGALFYYYMWWKTLHRTIRDTEAAMKEVRALLENKPINLLQGLAKGVEAMKQQAIASKLECMDLDFTGRAPRAGGAQQSPDTPKRVRKFTAQE